MPVRTKKPVARQLLPVTLIAAAAGGNISNTNGNNLKRRFDSNNNNNNYTKMETETKPPAAKKARCSPLSMWLNSKQATDEEEVKNAFGNGGFSNPELLVPTMWQEHLKGKNGAGALFAETTFSNGGFQNPHNAEPFGNGGFDKFGNGGFPPPAASFGNNGFPPLMSDEKEPFENGGFQSHQAAAHTGADADSLVEPFDNGGFPEIEEMMTVTSTVADDDEDEEEDLAGTSGA